VPLHLRPAPPELGTTWHGAFFQTTSIGDNRCAPGARSWGIAVLARAPAPTGVTATQLPKPFWELERRYLLCGDVVLGATVRVCTSHFSVRAATSDDQAAAVGNRLATYAASGGAARRWGGDYDGASTSSYLSDHNVLRRSGTLNW
jgi:hypothetical protein